MILNRGNVVETDSCSNNVLPINQSVVSKYKLKIKVLKNNTLQSTLNKLRIRSTRDVQESKQ